MQTTLSCFSPGRSIARFMSKASKTLPYGSHSVLLQCERLISRPKLSKALVVGANIIAQTECSATPTPSLFREMYNYLPYFWNSQLELSNGQTCRVFSHLDMQWKWNACCRRVSLDGCVKRLRTLQTPHATVHSSLVADDWFAAAQYLIDQKQYRPMLARRVGDRSQAKDLGIET